MRSELELERVREPLDLDAHTIKAFADRQVKLMADPKWPLTRWYNDEDFCRAYNTLVCLRAEIGRLRTALEAIRDSELLARDPCDPCETARAALKANRQCACIHTAGAHVDPATGLPRAQTIQCEEYKRKERDDDDVVG